MISNLRDELHITVLNAVVHHLNEMARAGRANVVTAWRSVLHLRIRNQEK